MPADLTDLKDTPIPRDESDLQMTRPETIGRSRELMAQISDGGWSLRFEDATTLERSLATAALEVQGQALGRMFAITLAAGGRMLLDNDNLEVRCLADVGRSRGQLLFSDRRETGAVACQITFERQLTASAAAQLEELTALKRAEQGETRVEISRYIFNEVLGRDLTETQKRHKAFLENPAHYRPADGMSLPRSISLQLVRGAPDAPAGIALPGFPANDPGGSSSVLKSDSARALPTGYDASLLISDYLMQTPLDAEDRPTFTTSTPHLQIAPSMALISRALEACPETARIVERRANALLTDHWITFGTDPHIEELALALLHEDRGLWGDATLAAQSTFQRDIWTDAISHRLDIFRTTAELLAAAGHTSRETSFDCNDLRDQAWAPPCENGVELHGRSQSTAFRMRIEGAPGSTRLTLEAGLSSRVSITLEEEEGRLANKASVSSGIRDIRNMNSAIAALDTIGCCVEEELAPKDSSPSP